MATAIEFKGIEMTRDEMPIRARKGKGVAHYMPAQPVILGSVDVVALCSVQLGSSGADVFAEGGDVPADTSVCKRCLSIWQAALNAERERRDAKLSARVAKREDVVAAELERREQLTEKREQTAPDAPKVARKGAKGAAQKRAAERAEKDTSLAEWKGKRAERAQKRAASKVVPAERPAGQSEREYVAAPSGGADLMATSVRGESSDGVKVALRPVYLTNTDAGWVAREEVTLSGVARTAMAATPDAAVSVLLGEALDAKRAKRDAEDKAADDKRAEEKRLIAVAPVAKIIAGLTDGKCAAEIPDVPAEDGTPRTKLVTLSGRMAMDTVAPIAELLGVDVIPVGKSAGALSPRKGTDVDGVKGVCPLCREQITLTNSGGVGTHRPGGVSPSGPQLSGTAVDTVAHGGSGGATPRDASNARRATRKATDRRPARRADMGAAYVQGTQETLSVAVSDDGKVSFDIEPATCEKDATRTPVVPRAAMAPKGVRDDGRSDGVAMLPLGESGYAGQKFDDERGVGVLSIVGGEKWDGALTGAEYRKLGAGARRRYWKKVADAKAKRLAGSRSLTTKEVAMGMRVTSQVAAATRRSNGKTRQAVKAQANARGKQVGALDMAGSPATVHANSGAPDLTVYGTDGTARTGRDDVSSVKVWQGTKG